MGMEGSYNKHTIQCCVTDATYVARAPTLLYTTITAGMTMVRDHLVLAAEHLPACARHNHQKEPRMSYIGVKEGLYVGSCHLYKKGVDIEHMGVKDGLYVGSGHLLRGDLTLTLYVRRGA